MFRRIWQFICKILILEYWLTMAARIWSNNGDISLTCWSITNFNFLLTATIFVLICFCHVFGLAFLLSLNFLFIRGYYISTRVEIFHITAIFFNSVCRVEISSRDENLHIINPLDSVESFLTFSVIFSNISWNIHEYEHSPDSSPFLYSWFYK